MVPNLLAHACAARGDGRAWHAGSVPSQQPNGPYLEAIQRAFQFVRPRHSLLNVTVGWAMWFGNRRAGLRDRWFRLRTSRHYRGCPQP
jgi:hypothetical protein